MMSSFRRALPSMLSASRIFISIPVALFVIDDHPDSRLWAALLVIVGMATDVLDGYLARTYDVVTEFGKIIDPVADKIAVGIIFIALVITGDIALWVAALVIGRDVLLLAGAFYIRSKRRVVVQSNWTGKIAVSALGVLGLLGIVDLPALEWFKALTTWFAVAMLFLSLGTYAQRIFFPQSETTEASA